MRNAYILLPALVLSGCMAEVLTTTAIQADLQAKQATAAQQTLNNVKNDTGQMNLQRAVDLYSAEKGGYPPSLEMLVPNFIDAIPARGDGGAFGYNPVTGKVLDNDAGPAPADYLTMEKIRTAINAYGTRTGYYPPTLNTLAQAGLLPAPPRTSTGAPFQYDNKTGAVSHPSESAMRLSTPARVPGPAVGGGGLMGEAMTGIAMQEQLNSNSNAGSSAAGTRGRSGARDAAAVQQDRQQKALDELGF